MLKYPSKKLRATLFNYVFFFLQRLNSNKNLMSPAPLSNPFVHQQTACWYRSLAPQQRSGRGEALAPLLLYRHAHYQLKWQVKSPRRSGRGEMLMWHHLTGLHRYMANGPWWGPIHWWSLANCMPIMARRFKMQEKSGWGVDKQRRTTVKKILSIWAKKKNEKRTETFIKGTDIRYSRVSNRN